MADDILDLLARINALSERIAALERQERVIDDAAATANTLVRRDGSSNISAALGTFSNGVAAPRSTGTAVFAFDSSGQGNTMTIASGATAYPFSNTNNFSGTVIVQELTASGNVATFLCGGGTVVMSSTTSGAWFEAFDTAGKICLFYSSGAIAIKNNIGASRTISVTAHRIRTSQ